jgi:hypothetical protein
LSELEAPRAVLELAGDRRFCAVWVNEVGGVTFRLGEGRESEFVKWTPKGTGINVYYDEMARLLWAVGGPRSRDMEHRVELRPWVGGAPARCVRHRSGPGTDRLLPAALGRRLLASLDQLPPRRGRTHTTSTWLTHQAEDLAVLPRRAVADPRLAVLE